MILKLPFTSDPCRSFTCSIDDVEYRFTTRWNDRASVWALDVELAEDSTPIAYGVHLRLGADLLAAYAPLLGRLVCVDKTASVGLGADPGVDDLGTRVEVWWFTADEVLSA